jgi:hypothetical protein
MTKTAERVYLLGGGPSRRLRFRLPVAKLRKRAEIVRAIADASRASGVWIATRADATDLLLREAFSTALSPTARRRRLGRLLLLHPLRLASLPALEDLFQPVAWGTAGFKTLPYEELAEVLAAENRGDLFVGAFVDTTAATLTLYRGDFEALSVPLSIFRPQAGGPAPDPDRLEVTDYGQTVRLGEYEAAADAILYEVDPEFRRRVNAERRAEDRSFGACLRRLRLLRGLRQGDFGAIPAKTIARIERGDTEKPHGKTLQAIAARLAVEPDEIITY